MSTFTIPRQDLDDETRLRAETYAREYLGAGEGISCYGVYVGPRVVQVGFETSPGKNRLKLEADRVTFDRWLKGAPAR